VKENQVAEVGDAFASLTLKRNKIMLMQMAHDKGISRKTDSIFNTDGQVHEHISREEANSVFDFEVEKVPNFIKVGDEYKMVDDMFSLVRTDTNDVVCNHSVGNEFTIAMTPRKVLDFLYDSIINEIGDMELEDIGTLRNGGISFVNFKYGDSYAIDGDQSEHKQFILFSDPLGVSRLTVGEHSVRIVCQNTLQRAMKQCEFKIAHTTNSYLLVQSALEGIRDRILEGRKTRELAKQLASKSVSTEQFENFLEKIYPIKGLSVTDDKVSRAVALRTTARDLVTKQFEGDDSFTNKNGWSMYNAASYFIDNPVKMSSRTDKASVIWDGWTGNRATKKSEMFDAALDTMGISVAA